MNPDHQIDHVWIDLTHLPDEVHEKQIPEVSSFFKRYVNLDTKTDLCPVRPSNHYHMGGIPTNRWGEVEDSQRSVIAGLYGAGECAAASFHGFNRLGTNSILELITMGSIVGNRVVDYLKDSAVEHRDLNPKNYQAKFSRYLSSSGNESLGKLRSRLRTVMTDKVSVFRTEQSISEAIETIDEIEERALQVSIANRRLPMNQELLQRWELDNLLLVARSICHAARYRKESRGAHFRDDYTTRLDEFNHHTLITMDHSGTCHLSQRDIDMSLFEAGGGHSEKFDFIERVY
jgi:succinate dehydrogenase / fumarate reductase flavoprotein subunit